MSIQYGWKKRFPQLTAYEAPHCYWRSGYWRKRPVGNMHDGNYPRLPALDGFAETCRRLRAQGGMVMPYVCLQILDPGPAENAP